MLAARASTLYSASRLTRTFATVVDTAGLKVAAIDNGQPTTSVTLLVKAGSRYETKPGVSHALKEFAFKSTAARSTLGTVRESELYGGVLSSTLSREHLAVTAEFLRGDEAFFVDVLASFITSARFKQHELEEYVLPSIESQKAAAQADPATVALEMAHTLAFRTGLGNSLAWAASSRPDIDAIKTYAHSAFAKGNFAVLGTGISQKALTTLVERHLGGHASSAAAPTSTPTTYHGGETRIESHEGAQTVFVGLGATGVSPTALATLCAHLSPQPSIKWSQGVSPIASEIPAGASVRAVLLPYSDASLFGLLVQGETADQVRRAGKAAVGALKASASTGAPELKKAVAKAKFEAADAVDGREGMVARLGPKVLSGDKDTTVASTLAAFDGVTQSAFTKVVSALLKAKPTYVVVGDTRSLPYADELGL